MAATTTQPMGTLPSGAEICTTFPDLFYLPELSLLITLIKCVKSISSWMSQLTHLFKVISRESWKTSRDTDPRGPQFDTPAVFGGLVWILVASTHVDPPNPLGWVMFVSVFCFVMTFLCMVIFSAGGHKNSSGWAAVDVAYHALAAFFYLSAGVALAYITVIRGFGESTKTYKIDIAAVVFAFVATLFYFIHAILSAIRWKNI